MSVACVREIVQGMLAEEEGRSLALKQLEQIAAKYPDLLATIATRLAANGEDGSYLENEEHEEELERYSSPTDAVREWLRENGEGTTSDIVDSLADRIDTESGNPRGVLYSTISSLKHRNKLKVRTNRDGSYVYSLPQEQSQEEEE